MAISTTDTATPAGRVRGEVLRRTRRSHPSYDTVEKLAVAADVSGRTITRAESGEASFEAVEKLAHALGIAPWDLWIPLDATHTAPRAWSSSSPEPAGEWVRIEAKLDALIAFHRSGGNTDHLEGV